MSNNKKNEFDPEKKILEESDDSFSNEGWLRDEKWSILTDDNKAILLADGADSGDSCSDDGASCGSCKSCSSCWSGDGN